MDPILQTVSGRMINLANPEPADININDIAHSLANLCRFTGHTKSFYSVAQHSLLASLNVGAEHALVALMHDAAEAYIGDLAAPLKYMLPAYREVEAGLWDAIAWKYRLPDELPAEVHEVDLRLLATEKRDVIGVRDIEWQCLAGIRPFDRRIVPMTAKAARVTFIKQFHYLMEVRRNATK